MKREDELKSQVKAQVDRYSEKSRTLIQGKKNLENQLSEAEQKLPEFVVARGNGTLRNLSDFNRTKTLIKNLKESIMEISITHDALNQQIQHGCRILKQTNRS